MATVFSGERILRIAVSLLLAALLWTTVKLSQPYRASIWIPVRYTGIPSNLQLTEVPPARLEVQVMGLGHQLLVPSVRSMGDTLVLDVGQYLEAGRVLSRTWRPDLQRYLSDALTIEAVLPDTLSLRYADKVNKRVPIVSRIQLSPSDGYRFTRPVRLVPDSVTLQGSRSELLQVTEWPTEAVALEGLRESSRLQVALASSPTVYLDPPLVEVELPLERFSEKVLRLPVVVRGSTGGMRLRLLPAQVELHCLVPVSRYTEVTPDDFELMVDISTLDTASHRAFPQVVRHPGFVQGIRLSPPAVRFVRTIR